MRTLLKLNAPLLWLSAAGLLGVLYNLPFWWQLWSQQNIQVALPLMLLYVLLMLLLMILTLWPLGWRVAMTVWLWVSAGISYFQTRYGVMIDPSMLRNALETDRTESMTLITGDLLLWLLAAALIPSLLLLKLRVTWPERWLRQLGQRSAALLLVLLSMVAVGWQAYQPLSSYVREHRSVKHQLVPLNVISASVSVFRERWKAPTEFQDTVTTASYLGDPTAPQVLVLVIGETARADHFPFNGYARNTTPQLQQQLSDGHWLNFGKVAACGTATAISLSCMLSYQSRTELDVEQARASSNVLDVLREAGFRVVWLDNNSGCKDMCTRAEAIQVQAVNYPDHPLCAGRDYCDDRILLELLQQQLAGIQENTVIVLHQIGSHGPAYSRRSDEVLKRYTPECISSDLSNCSAAEVVNSYDNSLATTDALLSGATALLQQSALPAQLLYISDHGESLGEHGLFLHGTPYALAPEAQTQVPMLWWQKSSNLNARDYRDCVAAELPEVVSHDHLFHTLHGLVQVTSNLYQANLDLTSPCRSNYAHSVSGG